jgi:LPXTG-site transpeptidase (sortase) family protein
MSRRWWWWAAATVLLLIAAGSLALSLHSQQRSLPPPVTPRPTRVITPSRVVSLAAVRSAPVTLSIPAIDLTTPVTRLGLNPDRTIQLPGFHEAGWYRLGPSPGQAGSAVIIGHVDSYQGPAVFFRLRSLRPGDRVVVKLADGVTTRFAVRKVAMYLKTRFPTRLVYGPHGYSGLQLVTCGGAFDYATRSYLSTVVVYTSLVAVDPGPGGKHR